MGNDFQFDVSGATARKTVWLDEEQIMPGGSIPAKIEMGLEHSRVSIPKGGRYFYHSFKTFSVWLPVPQIL
jgi:hypothetical protein